MDGPYVPIHSGEPVLNMKYSPSKLIHMIGSLCRPSFREMAYLFFLLLQAVLTTKLAPSFTCRYCYEVA